MGAIAKKGHKKVADTFEVITDLYLFSNLPLLYGGQPFC